MKKFLTSFKNWIILNKVTLIKILLWLLFITLVIVFLRYLDGKQTEYNEDSYEVVSELKTMDNYIYQCNSDDLVYTGRVYSDGREELYLEDKVLYFENTWYEVIDGERVDVDPAISRIKPHEIYSIIEKSNYVDKVEENGFSVYQFKGSSKELGYETDGYIFTNVYLKEGNVKAADVLGQSCVFDVVKGEN